MKMTDQFVDYETAIKLRELGFDDECLGYWTTGGRSVKNEKTLYIEFKNSKNSELNLPSAPTWQQVKRWLWRKHLYFIETTWTKDGIAVRLIGQENMISTKIIYTDTNYYSSPISGEIVMMAYAIHDLHRNKKP